MKRRAHRIFSSPPALQALPRTALLVLSLSAALLVGTPGVGSAAGSEFSDGANMGVDAVLLRPLSFFRVVVGSALLVPASVLNVFALPFEGPDVYKESVELFVLEPWDYLIRPLGQDMEGG